MLAILGPTAVGKSAIAHDVAVRLDAEIVVADPFQRYRGLAVAADAPGARAMAEVPYHFVGDLDRSEGSTAGEYGADAHRVIDEVRSRGRVPIVTGGTGLYVRAALCDMGFPEKVDAAARAEAERLVDLDLEGAVARLRELDVETAARIDRRNPRRVSRALELALSGAPTDRPTERLWDGSTRLETRLYSLVRAVPALDERIFVRVERELRDGLVDEIRLHLARADRHRAVDQIIGVREVAAMDRGEIHADALPAALAARTRKLARRQRSWLRRQPQLCELDLDDVPADQVVARIVNEWRNDSL